MELVGIHVVRLTASLSVVVMAIHVYMHVHVQVSALRDVVQHMRVLEQRVEGAEVLCQQTLANCEGVRAGETVHVNAEAVQRCTNDVARLARSMITEESTYFVAVSVGMCCSMLCHLVMSAGSEFPSG